MSWSTLACRFGLLPGSSKSLPDPMFTNHQWGPVAFTRGYHHNKIKLSFIAFQSDVYTQLNSYIQQIDSLTLQKTIGMYMSSTLSVHMVMVGKCNASFAYIVIKGHVIPPHIFDHAYGAGAIKCKACVTWFKKHTAQEGMSYAVQISGAYLGACHFRLCMLSEPHLHCALITALSR